jgi:hypothetical protein
MPTRMEEEVTALLPRSNRNSRYIRLHHPPLGLSFSRPVALPPASSRPWPMTRLQASSFSSVAMGTAVRITTPGPGTDPTGRSSSRPPVLPHATRRRWPSTPGLDNSFSLAATAAATVTSTTPGRGTGLPGRSSSRPQAHRPEAALLWLTTRAPVSLSCLEGAPTRTTPGHGTGPHGHSSSHPLVRRPEAIAL